MNGTPGAGEALERARKHPPGTLALVAGFALLVGTYAAWLGGDYGLGRGAQLGFALLAAALLVARPDARAVAAGGCYLLAALVVATPVLLNLPAFTAGAADPWALVFHPGAYLLALAFVIVAGLLAGAGAWLDRGRPAAGTEP